MRGRRHKTCSMPHDYDNEVSFQILYYESAFSASGDGQPMLSYFTRTILVLDSCLSSVIE